MTVSVSTVVQSQRRYGEEMGTVNTSAMLYVYTYTVATPDSNILNF